MKKETIIGLITIVAIVVIFLSVGCIKDKSQAAVSIIRSEGTPGVSELLENPEYGTEVKVYGNVSALGELLCPYFVLTSDEKSIEVWYDMMIEDDGTNRPALSVEGIENGNQVIITGELRSSTGTAPGTIFWASSIEIVVEDGEAVSLANVKDVEVMLIESFPVQVNYIVKGVHLNTSTMVDEITTIREGNTFFVTITTTEPATAICAQAITPFEDVVSLNVIGLKAGIYTVDVNGVRDTFELQTDNIIS